MRAIQSRRPGGHSSRSIGATAILAFFGMLLLAQEPGGPWKITESARRTAIASSILAEYQALVAIAAFLGQGTEKS